MDFRRVLVGSVLILLLSLSQTLTAQQSDAPTQSSDMSKLHADFGQNWFLGLEGALLKTDIRSVLLINNGSNLDYPNDLDRYSTNDKNPWSLAVNAGRFWQRDEQWFPGYALGLKYQHLFSQDITGQVMQYSVPRYTNYSYRWDVQVDALLAFAKLELVKLGFLTPYINGGIGVSRNHSASYHEIAYPGIDVRDSPAFGSHTKSQFTYDLGIGINVAMNPNIIVSLGYDYQNFGKLSSGSGQAQWVSQQLNLGNLKANEFVLGATYLFDSNKSNFK